MQVLVDGEERYRGVGDYRAVTSPVGIGPALGSRVDVESLVVAPLDPATMNEPTRTTARATLQTEGTQMRIPCVVSLLLLLTSSVQAVDPENYGKLKIYDGGGFTHKTYYNEIVSTNTVRTDFVGTGPLLTSSTLTSSTARIINCPRSVSTSIAEQMWKSREKGTDLCFGGLAIKQCIRVDYEEVKVYFVEFEYSISLINAKHAAGKDIPILWVGMEDQGSLKEIRFFHSFMDILGDGYLRADLAGVADVDGDGKHEIVIDVARYAGRCYEVIGFENGKPVQKEIDGDAWD